jgi:hypothetical protein
MLTSRFTPARKSPQRSEEEIFVNEAHADGPTREKKCARITEESIIGERLEG